MKYFCVFVIATAFTFSQENKAVLYVTSQGIQDVLPIQQGENTKDVILRLEERRNSLTAPNVIDKIEYYDNDENKLLSNFGFLSQELVLQWYALQTDGEVLEFWWRNYVQNGAKKKAKIRAWYVDPRITEFPGTRYDAEGKLGHYLSNDGVLTTTTSFKDESVDNIFRSTNKQDSAYVTFDPLLKEASWKPGGLEVDLLPNQWQSIKIKETGNAFDAKNGQPIGFTIQNISLPSDSAIRMELSSIAVANPNTGAHFGTSHSLKFYHQPISTYTQQGWYVRQFDFGMYIVVSYTNDNPFYSFDNISIIQSTPPNTEREVSMKVKNLGANVSPSEVDKVELKYKIGSAIGFTTALAVLDADTYKAKLPGINEGEKIYFYVVGYSTHGARFKSEVFVINQTTNVVDVSSKIETYSLLQNYPNPFNPSTNIEYKIPSNGFVSLKVFDILGKELVSLVNKQQDAGTYSVQFDASNLSSGLYFYQLRSGDFIEHKKMLLLK